MEREIKFRLYNRRDKQMYIFDPRWGNFGQGNGWVSGVLLEEFEKNGRTFAPSNQFQLEPESCEWLEFTGLLDIDGVEIYEGDIVRVTFDLNEEPFVGQVALYRTGQWLAMDDPTKRYTETKAIFIDWDNIVTVIGNIYESPELSEVTNDSN